MTLADAASPQDFVSLSLPEGLRLRPMRTCDTDAAVALVALAMDPEEGECARRSFAFHFRCVAGGQDDGRSLFLLESGVDIVGIVGLHRYLWGPTENVWLSWFALHPGFQGRGLGKQLLKAAEDLARRSGFTRLFVETYSTPIFSKARRFYDRHGFVPSGHVESYLPSGGSMIVYCKSL